jgi:group I intron endonuclease
MSILPKSPGIYIIRCLPTGKIYVGSAMDLRQRWLRHQATLRRHQHINRYLQNAWDKYGERAFTCEVLELVMPWSLLDQEQYWLDALQPYNREIGFNIALSAEAPTRGRKANPETIIKLSAIRKGRKRSPETRAKMSVSLTVVAVEPALKHGRS